MAALGLSPMACYSPISGFRAPGGSVTFDRNVGFVDLPVTVSCGRCVGCRLERSRQWAVRCVHEAQMHDANCFLTLTYDDEHLPEDGSLDVKHWQDFAKRMRKRGIKFRYFHCGEYGEENARPHYHAAIFGYGFHGDRKPWIQSRENTLYRSALLEGLWTYGHSSIGELTFQSAAYVARYVMKKVTGDQAEDHYQGRKPEYTTMSRRPGIGATWLAKFKNDVYPNDQVISNGRPAKPPKFYDSRLEASSPDIHAIIKRQRRERGGSRPHDNTPERLRVREQVQEERAARLTRK